MSVRRRTPVALPAIVIGLAVAAAFGSGVVSGAPSPSPSGSFSTVPGGPGGGGTDDAPANAGSASSDSTSDGATDDEDNAPDDESAGTDNATVDDDPARATATTDPLATDDTVPDEEAEVAALGPGVLPGVDWQVFDDQIAPSLIRAGALAVGIAVAKDGRLVHEAAYGVSDPATGEPVEADSRFRIASNSKLITSTVALQLVDEGVLSLDEPVLAPLAEQLGVTLGDPRMEQVTLRQILSHTSGFADFQSEFFRNQAVGCEDATIAAFRGNLSGTPGQSVNYSNMNFCIAGLLIEQATADSYEAAVYDRLLTPLGITDMRVTGNNDVRPGEVVHPGDPGRNFMEVLGGAGSWVASAADLVAITDSLDTTRPGWHPISPELADEMQGRTPAGSLARAHNLGLGLRLFGDAWGHTGTIQNAHSMVLHRADGFTFAVLASGSAPSESDDLAGIADRALRAIGNPLLSFVAPVPADRGLPDGEADA